MSKPFVSAILFLFLSKFSIAQSDTLYRYFSKSGEEAGSDSAFFYLKLYKQDNQWFGREYFKKGNTLKSEGNYLDKEGKIAIGSFKNYNDKGKLDFIAEWANGKLLSKTYFYKNGNKKAWIAYNDKNNDQKGWDEDGKEIRNYIVEKEARFKGGPGGWKKYLEKHLNAMVAAEANAPEGTYEVKLQFIINKEGFVTNVKAVSIPAACKPCAGEAVSALSNSPQWEPAIQNGEPVTYQAIQFVSFQVAGEGKKSKK